MFKLDGKIALVTGATGGIGRSIVKTFHAQGAKVIMVGRKKEVLENLKYELGSNCHYLTCDFNEYENVNSLIENAEKEIGNIDVLVCNAGVAKDSLVMRMKDEAWNDVIKLNLTSTFKLNKQAIKSMIKRKYGRIINISSIIGLSGNVGQSNYAASKAGMIAMSKSIALEVATKGITVNCVAPGYIDTPMTEGLNDNIKETIIAHIPMRKIGSPQDVANAALFLASEESLYITGHTLSINGGMYMS